MVDSFISLSKVMLVHALHVAYIWHGSHVTFWKAVIFLVVKVSPTTTVSKGGLFCMNRKRFFFPEKLLE